VQPVEDSEGFRVASNAFESTFREPAAASPPDSDSETPAVAFGAAGMGSPSTRRTLHVTIKPKEEPKEDPVPAVVADDPFAIPFVAVAAPAAPAPALGLSPQAGEGGRPLSSFFDKDDAFNALASSSHSAPLVGAGDPFAVLPEDLVVTSFAPAPALAPSTPPPTRVALSTDAAEAIASAASPDGSPGGWAAFPADRSGNLDSSA
jgi:hypothetical protein